MSITAISDLIARDRRLTGLGAVLDPAVLNEGLADLADTLITVPTPRYIRYKPGSNCLVSYPNKSATPFLYAKAYRHNYHEKLAKDQYRVANGWAPGQRLWALSQHRVLVRQFPLDGRLRALKVLTDPESCNRFAKRLFPGLSDGGRATIESLAYKPERRFVAKLSVAGANDSVVKFYGRRAFNRSLMNVRYLKTIDFQLLPRLLGRSKRRQVLALGWHPGQILRERLTESDCDHSTVCAVGEAIAALHCQPVSKLLHKWNLGSELQKLEALTESLVFLVPQCAKQARQLCDDICRQLLQVTDTMQVIHGDFHSKQILICDSGVRLLDADELAVGPAQLDIGTFIAHLFRDGLAGRIAPATVGRTVEAFLNSYRAAGGQTSSIKVYIAFALLKFSHHPFRACEDDWSEGIENIIELASQFVARQKSAVYSVGAL